MLGWLLPEERVLAVVAAVVVLACLSTGTGFTVRRVVDGYSELFGTNLLLLLICTRAVLWWRQRRPDARAWYNRIELGAELTLLRVTVFLFAYITLYTNIKVRIPVFNPGTHDAALRTFEESVLGFDVLALAGSLNRWPALVEGLDRVYHHDYIFMTLMALLLFVNAGPRHLRHLFTAMGVLYLTGIAITALWPTLGPCFQRREDYVWMKELGIDSWKSQELLLKALRVSRHASVEGTPIEARAFTGVAALPSLHVGHCMLLCRFAWHYRPRLLWLFVPVTLITWLATLVFGWHYPSDGVVSIALVLLAWEVSRRIVFGREAPGVLDPR